MPSHLANPPKRIIFHILKFLDPFASSSSSDDNVQNAHTCNPVLTCSTISKAWRAFFLTQNKASKYISKLAQIYFPEFEERHLSGGGGNSLSVSHALVRQILDSFDGKMLLSRVEYESKQRLHIAPTSQKLLQDAQKEKLFVSETVAPVLQHHEDSITNLKRVINLFCWCLWEKNQEESRIKKQLYQAQVQLTEMEELEEQLFGMEVDIRELQEEDNDNDALDDALCVICMEENRSALILPCKHLCLCDTCEKLVTDECPLCRGKVETKITSIKT